MEQANLVEARNLSVEFPLAGNRKIRGLSRVSLAIREREVLALVGESGCGKTTLGRTLIGLQKPTFGQIFFRGVPVGELPARQFRKYRRQMQIIFQDPWGSLDPRMRVGAILAEPLVTYRVCSSGRETETTVRQLMDAVGLTEEIYCRYPHELSGGQRQRVGIARAIALKPDFIVCDEPVSALDVSVQNQILNLLKELQAEFGLTYLFISHELSVVRFMAHRTCVMFLGTLCELGDTEILYNTPLHPYTRFLLDSMPAMDPEARGRKRMLLEGELPSGANPPSGCCFRTRCPYAKKICSQQVPSMRQVQGRLVACHLYE